MCCVHRAGIFRVTQDSRQSSVCDFQTSQDAQDKQVMQCRLALNCNWKTLQSDWDYQNQSASHPDSSTTIPSPKIWMFKTQWYHLKDTPIGQDWCGSNNSKRSGLKMAGQKFKTWGMFIHAPRKMAYFSPSMWTLYQWEESTTTETQVEQMDETS